MQAGIIIFWLRVRFFFGDVVCSSAKKKNTTDVYTCLMGGCARLLTPISTNTTTILTISKLQSKEMLTKTFCGLVKESDSWRIKSARLPCFRHRSDGAPKHLRNLRQNRARITGGQRLPPPSSSSFFPPPPVRWSCTAPSPDLPEEACCRLICSDIIWDFAVSCGLWASWQRALSVWCHPSARKNLSLSFCAAAAAAAASLPAACEKTKTKIPLRARANARLK